MCLEFSKVKSPSPLQTSPKVKSIPLLPLPDESQRAENCCEVLGEELVVFNSVIIIIPVMEFVELKRPTSC